MSEVTLVKPEQAYFKALPAQQYLSYHRDSFRHFCNVTSRYAIPTLETIQFLQEILDPETSLEIGAGNGDFSYHLKIKGTDSGIQTNPEIRPYYELTGQQPIKPPSTIELLDAVTAVKKYKPETVFASWVSQKYDESKGDIRDQAQSFLAGVDEEELFSLGIKRYIFLGNLDQHGKKRIMKYKHQELKFPWLVSRATNQCNNRLWIWDL